MNIDGIWQNIELFRAGVSHALTIGSFAIKVIGVVGVVWLIANIIISIGSVGGVVWLMVKFKSLLSLSHRFDVLEQKLADFEKTRGGKKCPQCGKFTIYLNPEITYYNYNNTQAKYRQWYCDDKSNCKYILQEAIERNDSFNDDFFI